MIASRTAALTGAAACGNDSVVRDILRPQREGQVRERTDGVGVDSRAPTSGRTALHFAILNDRLTTVDLLLSLGADPTIADGSGRRACHMCVVPKRHQILDRILATAAARGESGPTGAGAGSSASGSGAGASSGADSGSKSSWRASSPASATTGIGDFFAVLGGSSKSSKESP